MKKLLFSTLIVASCLLLNSCGVNYAVIDNQNQNSTQVHLASNNFKVVDTVTGSAELVYVLGFGGMNRKRLYENAYSDMVKKANLMSSSKALINFVTEEHFGGVPPFYYKRTITVSAHVIEFTK
ncbi:MAG: hypothetical protein H6577_20985 [Lewinellaceae bacterium]|nr:hypothetical protein [Saprospiraceae bacterium]MCB9340605.1 hypothetical protein [Lewinellaceae bacterium]